MFCLRRNALGYGLYETGIEPLDGPLLLLPDDLAIDLRGDAQRANVERNEDVSLTWKILGAAETLGNFFGGSAEPANSVSGSNTELRAPLKKRPEEVFEVRQREMLKKAAHSLSYTTTKLISLVGDKLGSKDGDLTAILPKDARTRYCRLRVAVAASVAAMPGNSENEPNPGMEPEQAREGSQRQLQRFAEHCVRIERTGGWPELSHEVRQEIINFEQIHYADLQPNSSAINQFLNVNQGRLSLPGSPTSQATAGPLDSLLGDLISTSPKAGGSPDTPAKAAPAAKGSFGGLCPLLPPPPPPASGVGMARLV